MKVPPLMVKDACELAPPAKRAKIVETLPFPEIVRLPVPADPM